MSTTRYLEKEHFEDVNSEHIFDLFDSLSSGVDVLELNILVGIPPSTEVISMF